MVASRYRLFFCHKLLLCEWRQKECLSVEEVYGSQGRRRSDFFAVYDFEDKTHKINNPELSD
jgi:hypothetical protein